MKPTIDVKRIPREHDTWLTDAGNALVRSLVGIGWRKISVAFEIRNDTVALVKLNAVLDDPLMAQRLRPETFADFIKVMQRFWDNAGPEPWRQGEYETWREGKRIVAKADFK